MPWIKTGADLTMYTQYGTECINKQAVCLNIRQFNNIDFSSEVSTVNKFVYTDEALLLVRLYNFQTTRIQELEYTNQTAQCVYTNLDR